MRMDDVVFRVSEILLKYTRAYGPANSVLFLLPHQDLSLVPLSS